MSQWTHVIGAVRIEYIIMSAYPQPDIEDKKTVVRNYVYNVFNQACPTGSEGPIKVNIILSKRGPIVIISGDLRDFGEARENDLKLILDWVNDRLETLDLKKGLWMRDGVIHCDIEGDENEYIIRPINKDGENALLSEMGLFKNGERIMKSLK